MKETEKQAFLQNVYAASIAEAVNRYQHFGQLDAVVADKKARQVYTAPYMNEQLTITSVEEVFDRLKEVFGCANWEVESQEGTYKATATSCKLCALAKKMGGASPCSGWCIDPMAAMIMALAEKQGKKAVVAAQSTLMDSASCSVSISIE
ncbi:MAG: hypothetical protein EOM15_06660 [Spirochaetia bacterium]|nr:hypothetical protein [Spirochaetia bacterium]